MKKIIINLFSIGFYQATNLIILVLLIPYYIQTYGVENFGIINLAQAFGLYVMTFCDFNFLVTGVRDISLNSENKSFALNHFIHSIISKLFLFVVVAILEGILILSVPNFRAIGFDLFIGMIYGLSLSILPNYLLQGLQYTQPISFIHAPIRILSIIVIYFLFNGINDYKWVNAIFASSNFLATLCIILFLIYTNKISTYYKFNLKSIFENYKFGYKVLISNLSVNVYLNMNTVFLGIFSSPEIVGLYSIAEKTIVGLRQVLSVTASIIYPAICRQLLISYDKLTKAIKFEFLFFVTSFTILAIITFFFSDIIITFLNKSSNATSQQILNILAFSLPVVAVNIPFTHYFYALHKENKIAFISIFAMIISVSFNLFLSNIYQGIGTAWSVIITESFYTGIVLIMFFLKKKEYSKI